MTEDKIIEILMKEADTQLTIEERDLLTIFSNESAKNSLFIDENRSILNNMPDFNAEASMFDADAALAKVKEQIQPEATVHKIQPVQKARVFNWQRYAAAAMFLIGLGTLAYTFLGQDSNQMVYTTGEDTQIITLIDGSEVTLNKHSTLTLSEDFGTELRDMRLEGEAYFDVTNNDDQPFTVKANGIEVEVIGTEFNINNKAKLDNIGVYVSEGKVKVSSLTTNTKVLLTEGESARYNRNTKALTKDGAGRMNATSWLTDKLRFENVALSQAIAEIESHFDINIVLDNQSLLECKYTSLFNDANAEEVLETLSAVFDFQIVKQGSTGYQLMGGKCD